MILGIGTDIVDIRRIERLLNDRFIARCFTPAEQAYANTKSDEAVRLNVYAKRYAAKEACAKALGCGIGKKAGLLEIECVPDKTGAPQLQLAGSALETLKAKNENANLHISLSDEPPYALAFVVISV
jgi:holo-[acyl-carrier protein] synthase